MNKQETDDLATKALSLQALKIALFFKSDEDKEGFLKFMSDAYDSITCKKEDLAREFLKSSIELGNLEKEIKRVNGIDMKSKG